LRGLAGHGSITRDTNRAEDGIRRDEGDQVTSNQDSPGDGVEFDASRAHMARVYDFWLGGKDNYAADRVVAEQVAAAYPDIRDAVRAQRAFLARAVRFLVTEAGVRQFLDIGTGLPSANNTHQVAQREAPESRVVYVDNDPIVLSHARALLTGTQEGETAYIEADLRDTSSILEGAADLLDFGQPVAVMLLGILQGIPDQDEPGAIIARLMDAVPPGSYLAISQIARDVAADEVAEGVQRYNQAATVPVAARTHAEVGQFFRGLELLEPGVVQAHRWRPEIWDLGSHRNLAIYAGVGRKP
jgi:trans-aconitate methyltransferase